MQLLIIEVVAVVVIVDIYPGYNSSIFILVEIDISYQNMPLGFLLKGLVYNLYFIRFVIFLPQKVTFI